jgi:hypothetical protein
MVEYDAYAFLWLLVLFYINYMDGTIEPLQLVIYLQVPASKTRPESNTSVAIIEYTREDSEPTMILSSCIITHVAMNLGLMSSMRHWPFYHLNLFVSCGDGLPTSSRRPTPHSFDARREPHYAID